MGIPKFRPGRAEGEHREITRRRKAGGTGGERHGEHKESTRRRKAGGQGENGKENGMENRGPVPHRGTMERDGERPVRRQEDERRDTRGRWYENGFDRQGERKESGRRPFGGH